MITDAPIPGIVSLLHDHPDWLRDRRIGLVSHPAAVDTHGVSTAQRLVETDGVRLSALFGPEHGFFGNAPAGAQVASARHPVWGVPAHSLYGATRKPTDEMLEGLDTLVFDIQDLGIRCYTYVSTLRFILEAAASHALEVIIADRPIPYPSTCDGAMLQPEQESFVGALPVPMLYGMTPGETASWIKAHYALDLDLKIAPLSMYARHHTQPFFSTPWIPPSPGIASRESALCYPALVFCEALPDLDFGRATGLPFQLLGATWMDGSVVAARFKASPLPGVRLVPHVYYIATGRNEGALVTGIRLIVTDPATFKPIETCLRLLSELQELYGADTVWNGHGARHDFMDKLLGNSDVRSRLMAGTSPDAIISDWEVSRSAFEETRRAALLYDPS